MNPRPAAHFFSGLAMGAITGLALVIGLIYVLNMTRVVAISVLGVPDIQGVLAWAYNNLRLSVIPFSLVFLLFCRDLVKLKKRLNAPGTSPEAIGRSESLIDMWARIFFGIGVIWTAIGLRNALLEGLGGLDPSAAASLGAFVILQRLVDGGILLALSTTIVGGVGGYVMHLMKALLAGKQLQAFYFQEEARQADAVGKTLAGIAGDLSRLVRHSGAEAGVNR
jgi:hypothetical protein